MDKHDECRERSAEQRDTKKQVLWKSLISHCHRKVKHATLWRHFSMWLFVFMSVCEYLIVHHDSVSCRGVKALEHTPVLTNCAVCESYLWLLCCSHQPWCIFEAASLCFDAHWVLQLVSGADFLCVAPDILTLICVTCRVRMRSTSMNSEDDIRLITAE